MPEQKKPADAHASEPAADGVDHRPDSDLDDGLDETADSFGDSRLDDAVAQLDRLDGAPVADHVEVFEDVHSRFRDALADVAEEQGPS